MKVWAPRPLLFAAAVGEVILAGRVWWHAAWEEAGVGGVVGISGSETSGLTTGLAIAALGGTVLLLTLRARGRRIVGVLLALLHAGAAVLGFWPPRPDDATVAAALRAVTLSEASALERALGGAWFGAVAVAGVAAAAWLVIRPGADSPRTVPTSARDVADSLSSWKAMDEGLDPTQEQR